MESDLFFGLIFLLFWLICEAVCIWFILKDRSTKPTIGYGPPAKTIPVRQTTAEAPNFYS